MVLPRGNAPRSVGYQPTALLLSYRRFSTERGLLSRSNVHEFTRVTSIAHDRNVKIFSSPANDRNRSQSIGGLTHHAALAAGAAREGRKISGLAGVRGLNFQFGLYDFR